MARFEDLDAWRRAARLSAEIYKGLADLRDFGFCDQIKRSGLSVLSNIAEGHERESGKETAQFFSYAKGSAGELRTQMCRHGHRLYRSRDRQGVAERSGRNFSNAACPHPFDETVNDTGLLHLES